MRTYFEDSLESKLIISSIDGSKNINMLFNRNRLILWISIFVLFFVSIGSVIWWMRSEFSNKSFTLRTEIEVMHNISTGLQKQAANIERINEGINSIFEDKNLKKVTVDSLSENGS